jgi:hypothetical protein
MSDARATILPYDRPPLELLHAVSVLCTTAAATIA